MEMDLKKDAPLPLMIGLSAEMLPPTNVNNIPKILGGLKLKSEVFGRAVDVLMVIYRSKLLSDEGANDIVNELYKSDPFSVVTDVFDDYHTMTNTCRGQNESLKTF